MEWFDPQKQALDALQEAEDDLVHHLATGPWGTELMKHTVRYLGHLWQTESNEGRCEDAKGIKVVIERLTVAGEKARPRKTQEEDDYGD